MDEFIRNGGALGGDEVAIVAREHAALQPERRHRAQRREHLGGDAARRGISVGEQPRTHVEVAEEERHGRDEGEDGHSQRHERHVPGVDDGDDEAAHELSRVGEDVAVGRVEALLDVNQRLAHPCRELLRPVDVVPADILAEDGLEVLLLPQRHLPVLGRLERRRSRRLGKRRGEAEPAPEGGRELGLRSMSRRGRGVHGEVVPAHMLTRMLTPMS
eukprot:scaffold23608_cov24-Tisochrysis_lutea.AAC.1